MKDDAYGQEVDPNQQHPGEPNPAMEGGSAKRSKADAVAIFVNLIRSIAIDETDVSKFICCVLTLKYFPIID